jgi:hypothetical protein
MGEAKNNEAWLCNTIRLGHGAFAAQRSEPRPHAARFGHVTCKVQPLTAAQTSSRQIYARQLPRRSQWYEGKIPWQREGVKLGSMAASQTGQE